MMKTLKLNEDDILEIVIEYYMSIYPEYVFSNASIIGEPSNDLRCICLLNEEEFNVTDEMMLDIDKENDFNGDHSFLENQ